MAIRNPDWYVLNSTRAYPVAEQATCSDNDGRRLPSHFIVDLNLKFPDTAGKYAFLSGLTITPRLVTVTIGCTESPVWQMPGYGVPLAAVTLLQPVVVGRPYPLDAIYPGTGGYIVFGPGVREEYSARFDTPDQTMFIPEAAASYPQLPIPSAGVLYDSRALTGLVLLKGGNDIEVFGDSRTIDAVTRDVIVFRLANKSTDVHRNVLSVYSGQCNKRPETNNCGDPQPIQSIGSVQPDCDGVISVRLQGCMEPSASADKTEVVLDCSAGLIDVCDPNANLPDEDGELPNMPGDECA